MFSTPEAVRRAVEGGFGRGRVLVVGDLMLDVYLWGDVCRISPEAPVPVVRLARRSETAGGEVGSSSTSRRPGSPPMSSCDGMGDRPSSRRGSSAAISK